MSLHLVSSMGSKNADVDVFTMGFVLTLPFVKNGGELSVNFLVCTVEFVHVVTRTKVNYKTFSQAY